MSLLEGPDLIGISGDMPALSDADIRTAVSRAYSRDRADAMFAGHRNGRSTGWGYAGREDGVWVSTHAGQAGIWARIADEAGHRGGRISWAVAEAVVRELFPCGQLGLFDLAVSA